MSHESYMTAVARELVATSEYEVAYPKHGLTTLVMLDDGEAKHSVITGWEVGYEKRKQAPVLILKVGEEVVSRLLLNDKMEWVGRHRTLPGYVCLRHNRHTAWQKLQTYSMYTRHFSIVPDEPEFYAKTIPPSQATRIDLSKYVWDLSSKVSIAKGAPYGIAIVGCDRPHYFEQVVRSIARNKEAHDWPVFVFLDKPTNKLDFKATADQTKICREFLPHAVVIPREENWGCGRNIIDARRQMFDNMQFERAFIFEDDMIISPNYISLVCRIFDWTAAQYSNIGAVQGWNRCYLTEEKQALNLKTLQCTFSNWWGYCMSKVAWSTIKKDMYDYERHFLATEYRFRPHEAVLTWYKYIMKTPSTQGQNPLLPSREELDVWENYAKWPPSGQDSTTMHLFKKYGWARVTTHIPRGKYIGEKGIHMTPAMWKQNRYTDLTYFEFPQDQDLDEFSFDLVPTASAKECVLPGLVRKHI